MSSDILTDRLILRPLTREVASQIVGPSRQPNWAAGYPTDGDREIAAMLLAPGYVEKDPDLGQRQMLDKESGLAIGGIGFFDPKPSGDRSERAKGMISVGYGIAPELRGKGLVVEALNAMIDFAISTGRVTRIVADTNIENIASRRVLERVGFNLERLEGSHVFYELAVS